jgi:hypothetical protein
MLLHVTATHKPEHCPMYDASLQATMVEQAKKAQALADELGVKVLFSASGAPDHVFFHLLEANSMDGVRRWLAAMPLKQEFRITPVEVTQTLVAQVEQEWRTS